MTRFSLLTCLAIVFGSSAVSAAELPKKVSDLPYCDDDKTGPKKGAPATNANNQATDAGEGDEPVNDRRSMEERVNQLEQQNRELAEKVMDLQNESKNHEQKIESLSPLTGRISGFADIGGFWVSGDGTGLVTDAGNKRFPSFKPGGKNGGTAGVPDTWVFLGDPLATIINSRGDPADTGGSRAVTVNQIGNGGKASFILNNINMDIFAGLGKDLSFSANIDFVPRVRDPQVATSSVVTTKQNGAVAFLNDFIDVRWAFAEYIVPIESFQLSLFVGKFDPVMGIEYRTQQATDRTGITPSLICRYTCGRPTGLKARAKFWDEKLAIALSITNGSSVVENFPFSNSEVDYNNMKTGSGRISTKLPVGAGWEFGAGGMIGAQDLQTADNVYHWQVVADTRLYVRGFEFSAEYVRGNAAGKTDRVAGAAQCGIAPCLRYQGAYGQMSFQALNWLTPYVRSDWRDAVNMDGNNYAYITKLLRFTGGFRFDVGQHVIIKAEFTKALALAGLPQIPGNMLATSSFIVKY